MPEIVNELFLYPNHGLKGQYRRAIRYAKILLKSFMNMGGVID